MDTYLLNDFYMDNVLQNFVLQYYKNLQQKFQKKFDYFF